MNTTTESQQKAVAALMQSPLAQRALAEVENERHATRREFLEKLAAAERERTATCEAAAAPLPALRANYVAAQKHLDTAAAAIFAAEYATMQTGARFDVRINTLRHELARLGGAAIELTRRNLFIEQRNAANLDDFRITSEPLAWGGLASTTRRVDKGGASRMAMIGDALAELDRLACDAEASPAQIEGRCEAIRAEIEAGPTTAARGAEYTVAENIDRSSPQTIVRRALRKYLKR